MTTLDITHAAQLDDLAARLSDVPGRHPQDAQIASTLLAYTMTCIHGCPSQMLLNTLERRGVSPREAREVARALTGLALRLGATLGRGDE